jgi:hypothetical protein
VTADVIVIETEAGIDIQTVEVAADDAPMVIETPAQQGPVGPSGLAEGLPTDPLAYYILSRS